MSDTKAGRGMWDHDIGNLWAPTAPVDFCERLPSPAPDLGHAPSYEEAVRTRALCGMGGGLGSCGSPKQLFRKWDN